MQLSSMLLILIGVAAGCSSKSFQDQEHEDSQYEELRAPRFAPAAEELAAKQRNRIEAELARLGAAHPWAGSYYEGDGLGENVSLEIAPASGFVFEWHGCMGLYDRNFGEVQEQNGRLQLSFHFENFQEGFEGLAPSLVPVEWAERHYLAPADELERFCDDANSGWEPRGDMHGRWLLRRGDEGRPAPGLPAVSEAFRKFLDAEPIVAEVIEIGSAYIEKNGETGIRVKLNRGTDAGIRNGRQMRLLSTGEWRELKVVDTDRSTSWGVVENGGTQATRPVVGWRFTSRVWDEGR